MRRIQEVFFLIRKFRLKCPIANIFREEARHIQPRHPKDAPVEQ